MPRARKLEIDFLVQCDAEPSRKRTRVEVTPPPVPIPELPIECKRTPSLDSTPSQVASPVNIQESQPFSILSLLPNFNVAQPQILSDVKSIECSECSFTSPNGHSITAHARVSHLRKPYACSDCGRCFGEKGNMNKHYRTVHLKMKKHKCDECGRTFAFMDGLKRHISMVHLHRRPFRCTVCLCSISHSKEVPCLSQCGMRFKQKSHHRRHVRSVHHIEFVESPR